MNLSNSICRAVAPLPQHSTAVIMRGAPHDSVLFCSMNCCQRLGKPGGPRFAKASDASLGYELDILSDLQALRESLVGFRY